MVADAIFTLLYQTFPVPNSTSSLCLSPSDSRISRLILGSLVALWCLAHGCPEVAVPSLRFLSCNHFCFTDVPEAVPDSASEGALVFPRTGAIGTIANPRRSPGDGEFRLHFGLRPIPP